MVGSTYITLCQKRPLSLYLLFHLTDSVSPSTPHYFFLRVEDWVSENLPAMCCSLLKHEASFHEARSLVYAEIIYGVYSGDTKNTKYLLAFLIYRSDSSNGDHSYSFIFLVLKMYL